MNGTGHAPSEPFLERARAALFASLREHVERLTWDAETLARHQTEKLRNLLAFAIEHSPFHAARLAGIDLDRFTLADLPRLPVMEKPAMMERFDEVVTDRRLRRGDLEALIAATGEEPIPALGEYAVLTSGGSSGTRGIFVFDAPALADFFATVMRPSIARMAAQPSTAGSTMAIIAAGSPVHATGLSSRLLAGGPTTITAIPATLPFAEIVARVHALEPGSALLGYPSVVGRLAEEQLAGRLAFHPVSVTTTSESLSPATRARIEEAFGIPVVNAFGSSEGLIGASAPGEEALTFASDGCIVELVDEDDQPVPPGEPSASVLVTNLFNLTQPLIRYRMEDRFIQQPPAEDHGHLRATVEGRAAEMLRWGDVVVHALAVIEELDRTAGVADYVIRQTPTGVDIDVVATGELPGDIISEHIREALGTAGFGKAQVALRVVSGVPRDPRTGKTARVVPLEPAP